MLQQNQKSTREAANEILRLDSSLQQSIDDDDWDESDEEDENLEVSASDEITNFDAAPKTTRLNQNRKRKMSFDLPNPQPKILREENRQISSKAQSENVTNKLYENAKTVLQPQEKLAEVDKVRIMQVNAHGALTSTKPSRCKIFIAMPECKMAPLKSENLLIKIIKTLAPSYSRAWQ